MLRRPIADVFAFLPDFENIPKWNYAIVETHKVSEGPIGVGTIYQQVRSVPSRSEEHFEVTAHNPPRQLEIQGQLGPFPSRLSYTLDATPEGTRVTNTVELELRGPSVHTCSPVLLLIVARVLWTARPPARPLLGAEATIAEPAGPTTFKCPWRCVPPAHPPAARRRRSPWLPWTASVSELPVSSAPYQLTSASRGPSMTSSWTAHPLLASPQDHLAAPRSDTVGQWGRWIFAIGRARCVPRRSCVGIGGH